MTRAVWPISSSSWSPFSASQIFAVPSSLAVITRSPWASNSASFTAALCPSRTATSTPDFAFQTRAVSSWLAVTTRSSFELKLASVIVPVWPTSSCCSSPVFAFQIRAVPSSPAVRASSPLALTSAARRVALLPSSDASLRPAGVQSRASPSDPTVRIGLPFGPTATALSAPEGWRDIESRLPPGRRQTRTAESSLKPTSRRPSGLNARLRTTGPPFDSTLVTSIPEWGCQTEIAPSASAVATRPLADETAIAVVLAPDPSQGDRFIAAVDRPDSSGAIAACGTE